MSTTAFVLFLCSVSIAVAQAPATRPVAQPARREASTRPAIQPMIPVAPAPNPHWTQTGCRYCHAMIGNEPRPIPIDQVEDVCLKCHDGRQARMEPHPVGRSFEHTSRPKDWPAPGGKVTCITCHLVHPGGQYDGPRPTDNAMFLRAWNGDLLSFCARCHGGANQPQQRYNPHLVQVKSGKVDSRSCAFCHTQPVWFGAQAARTGNPGLRGGPVNLCIGCHTTHLDWFTPGHIGAKTTPEIRAALDRLAARRGIVPPEGAGLAAGFLPLAPGDTLMCGTCHNPHEVGVFPPGSTLASGAMWPGQPREQLRGLGKELCSACHDK